MNESEELKFENFYKNMDKRKELRNEALGFLGYTPDGKMIIPWDRSYNPEELNDFFLRIKKRYESDLYGILEIRSPEHYSDMIFNSDIKTKSNFESLFKAEQNWKMLNACLIGFCLLPHEVLSTDVMECMVILVLDSMDYVEDATLNLIHDSIRDSFMEHYISSEELKKFTNGKDISEDDLFDIYDMIAIAENMKKIDYDHYNHSILGIIHDMSNGDPEKMEYVFDKMIKDGLIPDL